MKELDPFRVMLGVIFAQVNADLLLQLATSIGLQFNATLEGDDNYSHKTRIRALLPRIVAAYDTLDEAQARGAANALAGAVCANPTLLENALPSLQKVGWDIQGGALVAIDPEIREMFFPKGSRWDAFTVLRGIFDGATKELVIVDGYCDQQVFALLASRRDKPLHVRILCSQNAPAVAAEAIAFAQQHTGWSFEVRRTKDFHDRFVLIDNTDCIHIGASINGAGKTAFMISKVEDPDNRAALSAQIEQSWQSATVVP